MWGTIPMTDFGDDNADFDVSDFLEKLANKSISTLTNLSTAQRLAEGPLQIAALFPASYILVYPKLGGIIDKLTHDLGPVPTPKADFTVAAAPEVSIPSTKFRPT